MLNGLNILPSYTDYFHLNPATTGLNTASVFIGGILGPLVSGAASDRLGRRPTILWGSLVTLAGVILQTAAQNTAMFAAARIILGFGSAVSGIAAGIYLSETFPSRWRAWGVGLLNDFYYVGALLAAGITLGTGQWQSTWAWRAPSLFQGVFSLLCVAVLPFVPESPRWLAYQGLHDDSRTVVAQTNAAAGGGNDVDDAVVAAVYKEIVDTLSWEKEEGRTMSPVDIVKTPVARRRLLIGISPGPFSCVAGNIIASYYLGSELDTAGVTDSNDQLKAVGVTSCSRFRVPISPPAFSQQYIKTDIDPSIVRVPRTSSSTSGAWPAASPAPSWQIAGGGSRPPSSRRDSSPPACSSSGAFLRSTPTTLTARPKVSSTAT